MEVCCKEEENMSENVPQILQSGSGVCLWRRRWKWSSVCNKSKIRQKLDWKKKLLALVNCLQIAITLRNSPTPVSAWKKNPPTISHGCWLVPKVFLFSPHLLGGVDDEQLETQKKTYFKSRSSLRKKSGMSLMSFMSKCKMMFLIMSRALLKGGVFMPSGKKKKPYTIPSQLITLLCCYLARLG